VTYDWKTFYPNLEGREITDVFNIPDYANLSAEAKTWARKYKENMAKAHFEAKGNSLSELAVAAPAPSPSTNSQDTSAQQLHQQLVETQARLIAELSGSPAPKGNGKKGAQNGSAFGRNRDLADE